MMKVAVVGLSAMGMGITKSSLRASLDTVGCDVSEDKRSIFLSLEVMLPRHPLKQLLMLTVSQL